MDQDFDAALGSLDEERRSFLKKMAMGGVFVVPTVASFTMTGIDAVYAQTPSNSGNTDDSGVADDSAENTTTTEAEPDGTTTTTEPDDTTTTTTTNPNQTTTTTNPNQTTTTTKPNQVIINPNQ